ncbi:MAG: hypothetical protein C4529_04805 [Deltaproteobacteria bacterium]|nr:MAG: hypothetical protein C4529_04805 [Deltaproteobacteria bacterium]
MGSILFFSISVVPYVSLPVSDRPARLLVNTERCLLPNRIKVYGFCGRNVRSKEYPSRKELRVFRLPGSGVSVVCSHSGERPTV